MKNFKALLIILLFLTTIVLIGCTNKNSTSNNTNNTIVYYLPDNLNGGGTAVEGELSDTVVSSYVDTSYQELTDFDKNGDEETKTSIDLDSLSAGDYTGYSLSKKGKLSITDEGVYELSGTLNGFVSVDALAGDIKIILNGVSIMVPETTASAAIVFKGSDTDTVGKRVLAIKNGTTSTLADSILNTDNNDGDEAVIQAKKNATLTICGSGTLNINASGENTTGIKLKTVLNIINTTINIDAKNNGIKANQMINIVDANISVTSLNDGIKTDMEASTTADATLYSSSKDYGYIHIVNSSIVINSSDDGLSANNTLIIENSDLNTINITANSGIPSTVSEQSSNNASGKAIKVSGITLIDGDNETDYKASYNDNYALLITGGRFIINSNDDAIHSNGNIIITGGTFTINTGDDAIHADYLTRINGGTFTISKCYEGIEGANIEILGGYINLTSVDDGINAANSDFSNNYPFSLYIAGGELYINAQGDGVDSNGTLTITGGLVVVCGPTDRNNGSLDSEKGILVNGGNVFAVGSLGMVETPGTNSIQPYISINMTGVQNANTTVAVYDTDHETILFSIAPNKVYQSIIISLSSFIKGSTYYVKVGQIEYKVTLNNIANTIGSSGIMGPIGNRPGRM